MKLWHVEWLNSDLFVLLLQAVAMVLFEDCMLQSPDGHKYVIH